MGNERDRSRDRGGPTWRIMVALSILTGGALVYQWYQRSQEASAPESASATSLEGPGYSVRPSPLGDGILEIDGRNLFPVQTPRQSIERGRERIERTCGPIIVFDASPEAVPQTKAHAKVPNASKCFQ